MNRENILIGLGASIVVLFFAILADTYFNSDHKHCYGIVAGKHYIPAHTTHHLRTHRSGKSTYHTVETVYHPEQFIIIVEGERKKHFENSVSRVKYYSLKDGDACKYTELTGRIFGFTTDIID